VPILRLNWKTITTGATISSLTTSWVQYSYTANSGDVTSNGELSFEIIPNSTTHAFYFDDFTITWQFIQFMQIQLNLMKEQNLPFGVIKLYFIH